MIIISISISSSDRKYLLKEYLLYLLISKLVKIVISIINIIWINISNGNSDMYILLNYRQHHYIFT